MDGSDAGLNAALAQAAVAAGEVPMAEPTPMESVGVKPELRLIDSPASTEGVTADSGEEYVSFEDAFLAERALDTGVEPDQEGVTTADPAQPLTREQILDQREAELNRREEETALQQTIAQNNQYWTNKYQEGLQWKAQQLAEIEAYGQQTGRSDFEVELAKTRFREETYEPWLNEYYLAREQGIVEPYKAAQGSDAISLIIRDNGLDASDRPALLKHIANPEMMRAVAETMGIERAKVAQRDQVVTRKAAKNVARAMTQEQITAQNPSGGRRPATQVTGSDAELDFMVKNRPTLRRVS
jgi:hypothetical protein